MVGEGDGAISIGTLFFKEDHALAVKPEGVVLEYVIRSWIVLMPASMSFFPLAFPTSFHLVIGSEA